MEITIEQIVSTFRSSTEEKRLKDIKADVVALVMQNKELTLFDEDVADIEQQVEKLIKEDKKREEESCLLYLKGKYKKRLYRKPDELTLMQVLGLYTEESLEDFLNGGKTSQKIYEILK